ncbi:MAG TPA: GxxExxY protein, partial [Firmicutes bacterium]|nr:GxxExxY protein [Bacillota bacterium]
VHRTLGPGYMESVYEEALSIELTIRGIPIERQKRIAVSYKGYNIGEGRIDLLVKNTVIVELKTVEALIPVHKAQLISYLKATEKQIGLLINFNVSLLKDGIKR